MNEILGMRMSSVDIFAGSKVATTPSDRIAYIINSNIIISARRADKFQFLFGVTLQTRSPVFVRL